MQDGGGYYMRTVSGRKIYILDPRPEDFIIEDIAHHLSMINRYNGGTIYPFSVARHSIIISHHLPQELQLEGLLHDAHEMSIGDDTTPKKKAIQEVKAVEMRHEAAMRRRFGLPFPITPLVKEIDHRMYVTEVEQLRPMSSADMPGVYALPVRLKETSWIDDRAEFIARFRELTSCR